MASIIGGLAYWALVAMGVNANIGVLVTFFTVCAIRWIAVRYHISLPLLRDEDEVEERRRRKS